MTSSLQFTEPDSSTLQPSNMSQSGLSTQDYCYLKCWVALVRVGKQLLVQVFHWGFPNLHKLTLKQGLDQLPGYSNTKFKADFNKEERGKIENGAVSDFDITLLYTIIQRLCRLVPAAGQLSANNASASKLSELILKVKNTRNKFAHPLLGLTEVEMACHVSEMKQLFEQVVDEAQKEFNVDVTEGNNLKNEISSQLMQIVQAPLPPSTIAEQLFQIKQEKERIVLQEGLNDLKQSYNNFSEVSVTPWPFAPVRRKLEDVFVKMNLKFTSSFSLQHRLTEKECIVQVDDLLKTTHLDLSEPGFILLTGQSGVGKTIIMKYIVSAWLNSSQSTVINIDKYDFVFYVDCRQTCMNNWYSLFGQMMPTTSNLFLEDEFKKIISSFKCIFLLDNVDEIRNQSLLLIDELISTSSDVRIIATATQDPGHYIFQKTQNKRPMNLVIEGLPSDSAEQYVNMLHESLPIDFRSNRVENFFSEVLSDDYLLKNWFTNPEILSYVFFNWCFSSQTPSGCSTLTHILLQSFNLILKKLQSRIVSKSLPGVMEQHVLQVKLKSFLVELGRIATSSLKDGTSGLGFKSTTQLILKCQELGLPANVLLSEFLCFRETFDENILKTSVNVTFPSVSFQEFCSAYHLCNHLTTTDDNLKDVLNIDCLDSSNANKTRITNILKFLVGLLSTSDSDTLSKFSSHIVDILQNFCQLTKSSQWFQIIEESQGHEALTGKVLKLLNGIWAVEDSGISSLVVKLIETSPPECLTITAVKDPSTLPHFRDALAACAKVGHPIAVSLYIYSHFWKIGSDYSENYISSIFDNGSNCQLENFAGHLRSHSFSLIPKFCKRLALQIKSNDIHELNKAILNFSQIQLLSLNLSLEESSSDYNHVSRLCLKPLTLLSLDLCGVTAESLAQSCAAAAQLYPSYARLCLRRTALDGRRARDFVDLLSEAQVRVGSLVIGSSVKLQTHEMLNLKAEARKFIGCTNLKWIEL